MSQRSESREPLHEPVLLDEVLTYLDPAPGARMLDCTFGSGGHSRALSKKLGTAGELIALDWDPNSPDYAPFDPDGLKCDFAFVKGNFAHVTNLLHERGISSDFDGVLADLGWSMDQLRRGDRGFSFEKDDYLDMRYNPEAKQTAADLIETLSAEELTGLFRQHGEHRNGSRLAEAIVSRREQQPLQRTLQLFDLIGEVVGGRNKNSVAARVFQALRTEVNHELENLERLLDQMPDLLKPGGRGCVISFHSLEDRRVKDAFLKGHRKGVYDILTEKPVRPERDEMENNPSARSARLRAVERRQP